jgi:arylsulfatase A-like enzyme
MVGMSLAGCLEETARLDDTVRRPNVLFLFTDDQRFDTIGALGNEQIRTPNLDRLVQRGTVFRNAYIMGSMSGAVCMPSRAMLMSSRSLWRLEKDGQKIPVEEKTLPEVFRETGYRTFHTGKWHQDKASFHRSFTHAANIMFGGMSNHYRVPLQDFDPTGKYGRDRTYVRQGEHSTELFAEAAVAFLNKPDPRPFFAYVSFTAPHDPRHTEERYHWPYPQEEMPVPANFLPEHPFDNGELVVRDEQLAPWPRRREDVQEHLKDYYAMITHVDEAIGRILQTLEDTGQAGNTIIVFSGDNGLAVGQHGLMGKQNLYEHSIHVPLVFAGPGVPSETQREDLCYLNDIFPTLCALADLKTPEMVEGKNLVPAIRNQWRVKRDRVVFAYKNFQRGMRYKDWKLIVYNVKGTKHTQLFDLISDPWEMRNLAEQPQQQDRVRRLKAILQEELSAMGDQALLEKAGWGVPEIPAWESHGHKWPTKHDR